MFSWLITQNDVEKIQRQIQITPKINKTIEKKRKLDQLEINENLSTNSSKKNISSWNDHSISSVTPWTSSKILQPKQIETFSFLPSKEILTWNKKSNEDLISKAVPLTLQTLPWQNTQNIISSSLSPKKIEGNSLSLPLKDITWNQKYDDKSISSTPPLTSSWQDISLIPKTIEETSLTPLSKHIWNQIPWLSSPKKIERNSLSLPLKDITWDQKYDDKSISSTPPLTSSWQKTQDIFLSQPLTDTQNQKDAILPLPQKNNTIQNKTISTLSFQPKEKKIDMNSIKTDKKLSNLININKEVSPWFFDFLWDIAYPFFADPDIPNETKIKELIKHWDFSQGIPENDLEDEKFWLQFPENEEIYQFLKDYKGQFTKEHFNKILSYLWNKLNNKSDSQQLEKEVNNLEKTFYKLRNKKLQKSLIDFIFKPNLIEEKQSTELNEREKPQQSFWTPFSFTTSKWWPFFQEEPQSQLPKKNQNTKPLTVKQSSFLETKLTDLQKYSSYILEKKKNELISLLTHPDFSLKWTNENKLKVFSNYSQLLQTLIKKYRQNLKLDQTDEIIEDIPEQFKNFFKNKENIQNPLTFSKNIIHGQKEDYILLLNYGTSSQLHQLYKTLIEPTGDDLYNPLFSISKPRYENWANFVQTIFQELKNQITPKNQEQIQKLVKYEQQYKKLFL